MDAARQAGTPCGVDTPAQHHLVLALAAGLHLRWGGPPGPRGSPWTRSRLEEPSACHSRKAGQGAGCGPGGPPHHLCQWGRGIDGPELADSVPVGVLEMILQLGRGINAAEWVSASAGVMAVLVLQWGRGINAAE